MFQRGSALSRAAPVFGERRTPALVRDLCPFPVPQEPSRSGPEAEEIVLLIAHSRCLVALLVSVQAVARGGTYTNLCALLLRR
jgi:hypothetical protein